MENWTKLEHVFSSFVCLEDGRLHPMYDIA